MKKRILALVLALIMALSLCGFASAAESTDEQLSAARTLLNKTGIMVGYPDGSFGEGDTLTRAMGAKIMAYMTLGAEAAEALTATVDPFDDVDRNYWAARYIAYCAVKGIIKGVGDNLFKPDNILTYEQLLAMTLRHLGYGQNGEFEDDNWNIRVLEYANVIPDFSKSKVRPEPVPRGETAGIIYNVMFTPVVEMKKDGAGKVTYAPVTTGKKTTAEALGIEVVKLSDTTATFKVDGVQMDAAFAIDKDSAYPSATTINFEVAKSNWYPAALVKCDGDLVTLMLTDGTTKSLPFAKSSKDDYDWVKGNLVGKIVLYREVSTDVDKPQLELNTTWCDTGTADLDGSSLLDGRIVLGNETVFLVHGIDGAFEWYRRYVGRNTIAPIYEAQYCEYEAEDGTQYIYIANGENSTNYPSHGQIFLVDPAVYNTGKGSTGASMYYATEGVMDGEAGTIKFTQFCGKNFFESDPMPGLYPSVSYEGMRVDDAGAARNPLFEMFVGDVSLNTTNIPLQGIKHERGEFYIGTNEQFRENVATKLSKTSMSSICLKPNNPNSKAFYFDINPFGEVKMSMRSLSEVSEDDHAYVWGTVTSNGKLMNLYIVRSEWSRWNEWINYWTTSTPELPDYTVSSVMFVVDPKSYSESKVGGETCFSTKGAFGDNIGELALKQSVGTEFFKTSTPLPGIYTGVSAENGKIISMSRTYPENPIIRGCLDGVKLTADMEGVLAGAFFPLKGYSCQSGTITLATDSEYRTSHLGASSKAAVYPVSENAPVLCFSIDQSGKVTTKTLAVSALGSNANAYVWGTLSNGTINRLYIVVSENPQWNGQWAITVAK